MSDLKGIEGKFVESWDGWDEIDSGVLYFYDVKLLPEYEYLMKDINGVKSVGVCVSVNECFIQFDFFDENNDFILSKAFDLKVSLGGPFEKE